ncbi:MAG: septal ring lytic transglycosylase RlpA family protein [Betaproteobacteria bacterium]|nr:septal ring lytic transglycosylase RlpA family protein [Betaproteobacteria bacterium]
MGCKAKKKGSTFRLGLVLFFCLNILQFGTGCATLEPFGKTLTQGEIPAEWLSAERGWASFYHPSLAGRKTANGEVYKDELYTAAHPTLPFGTLVLVRRVATGRYTIVRINDRGPFVKGRVIDLSRTAAARLGLIAAGVGKVEVFVIPPEHPLLAHL